MHYNKADVYCDFKMKKKDFLDNLAKILEKKTVAETSKLSDLEFDSLNALDLMTFNDINFKDLNISTDEFEKCKTVKDLIKLYGSNIN